MNLIENYIVVPIPTSFLSKTDNLYDWLRKLDCCFVVDNTRNCFLIFNLSKQLTKELVENFQPLVWEFHTYPTPKECYVELFRHINETLYRNILDYRDAHHSKPVQFTTYSDMWETIAQAFFSERKSDVRKYLIKDLTGFELCHPNSFIERHGINVSADEDSGHFNLIKSYAIVRYVFSMDSLPEEAFYSLAYAIDKERRCLILFNPKLENIEKLCKSDKPISGIYSAGLPPEHYNKLFEHVNRQMNINLNAIHSKGRNRWLSTPMSEQSIGICQTRYLHGIDVGALEVEEKSE